MDNSRDVHWNGSVYRCEQDRAATTVWDAEDDLFSLPGTDWTDEQIQGVLVVYYHARERGERRGEIGLQYELRRLLGAADECHGHDRGRR